VNTGLLWLFGFLGPALQLPNHYAFGVFIYHNHWAAYSVMMSCVAFGFGLRAVQTSPKPWFHTPFLTYLLFIGLLFSSVISVASRSGVMAYLTLLVIMLFRLRRHAFQKKIGTIMVALLLLFSSLYYANIVEKTMASGSLTSGRLTIYSATLRQVLVHPFAGWGLNSFSRMQPLLIPMADAHYSTPHMDYLQAAFEWGIPFAILVTALLAYAMVRLFPRHDPMSFGLWLGCCFLAAFAAFDFPTQSPAVLLLGFTFLGMLHTRRQMLGSLDEKPNPVDIAPNPRKL
jgi:hypothetical protein